MKNRALFGDMRILSGGNGGGVPRVPIPNTTVKPSSADGTWTAGSWESRTLPSDPYIGLIMQASQKDARFISFLCTTQTTSVINKDVIRPMER